MSRWSDAYADEDARHAPAERRPFVDRAANAIASTPESELDALIVGALDATPIPLYELEYRVGRTAPHLLGINSVLMHAICKRLTVLVAAGSVVRRHYRDTASGKDEYSLGGTP